MSNMNYDWVHCSVPTDSVTPLSVAHKGNRAMINAINNIVKNNPSARAGSLQESITNSLLWNKEEEPGANPGKLQSDWLLKLSCP